MAMHQQNVIMWLGVEVAEKKERIAELENELVDALERIEELERPKDTVEEGAGYASRTDHAGERW